MNMMKIFYQSSIKSVKQNVKNYFYRNNYSDLNDEDIAEKLLNDESSL